MISFGNIFKKFQGKTKTEAMYWFNLPEYRKWSPDNKNNFGDEIGPYIYKQITGARPILYDIQTSNNQLHYITVGSLFELANPYSIVWGTGIMYSDSKLVKPYKIYAVRGKHTYNRLTKIGIDCPNVFGDPALLMPKYYNPDVLTKSKVGIIPHYVNYKEVCALYGHTEEVLIINVLNDPEKVIDDILSCESIISSSLHGIILAHAYGLPVAWVEFSEKLGGDRIKFFDHYSIFNIEENDIKCNNIGGKALKLIDIQNIISQTPQPSNQYNTDQLLASCPFNLDF